MLAAKTEVCYLASNLKSGIGLLNEAILYLHVPPTTPSAQHSRGGVPRPDNTYRYIDTVVLYAIQRDFGIFPFRLVRLSE